MDPRVINLHVHVHKSVCVHMCVCVCEFNSHIYMYIMVREVSAMLVETATFLPMAPFGLFGGGDSKILCWRLGGNVEYSGMHLRSPTSGPRFSTSRWIRLQASSIS